MIKYKVYNPAIDLTIQHKDALIGFLFTHLEQYGDKKEDIGKAISYAMKEIPSFGGFVLEGIEDEKTIGVVVVNCTGMSGYIPENILVYIAVDNSQRGKGYGKKLMQNAIEIAKGDIALHVEKDNPARFLYEKVGFTNPYLEMRLKK